MQLSLTSDMTSSPDHVPERPAVILAEGSRLGGFVQALLRRRQHRFPRLKLPKVVHLPHELHLFYGKTRRTDVTS